MSNRQPTIFDTHRELVRTRQEAEWNNLLLIGISGSLSSIHDEIAAARETNEEALAIQQELLTREVMQAKLEEFIYQTEKMVTEFDKPGTDAAPSTRYFLLIGILKTIQAEGISTAVIRGRDNKAAFDAVVRRASGMVKALEGHEEVQQALAWADEERKREEEKRKRLAQMKKLAREQDEQARRARAEEKERVRRQQAEEVAQAERDRQAQIGGLVRRIEALKASKKKLPFAEWHKNKFPFLKGVQPPVWHLLVIGLWWLPGCGMVWIPVWYWLEARAAD